ncbi:alpha/beta fold hydrolase [Mycolicibacterium moriokaense]|nr:alpha/beta fold hydrolase [Mycolicibacterium moriokaense]
MVTSRFVGNGDVRVHFLDSGGDDHGAPIVFVPGMTDVADDYVEVLALFGRRAVVVDIRGHGRSGAPASGYDLDTLSTDLGAVVDAITDGPVHLATFSRGTSCAVAWAINHPARVRSLSIGDYVPEHKVLPPGVARRLLDGRWRGTPVKERLDERAAIQTFQAATAQSFWDDVAALQPPLLVVRSGDSVLVGEPEWARYQRLFPQAMLVEFDDSPHDIFRPDRARYPLLVGRHADVVDGQH